MPSKITSSSWFQNACVLIVGILYFLLCEYMVNHPMPLPSTWMIGVTLPVWYLLSILLLYPNDKKARTCSRKRYLIINFLRLLRGLLYLGLLHILLIAVQGHSLSYSRDLDPVLYHRLLICFILSGIAFFFCTITGALTLGRAAAYLDPNCKKKKIWKSGFLCVVIHFAIVALWYYSMVIGYHLFDYPQFISGLDLPVWLTSLYLMMIFLIAAIHSVVECILRRSVPFHFSSSHSKDLL